MAQYACNGIHIEADSFGDRKNPCLLLIMGLGMQMTAWQDGFCQQLAEQGFFVLRFDNRDVGLSSNFEHAGLPSIPWAFLKYQLGMKIKAPYSLHDMAKDSIALLDQFGIDKAHIVGASMGGMIAQNLAIHFPRRLLSLTSIMSTPGGRGLPGPTPKARRALLQPPTPGANPSTPEGVEKLVSQYVNTFSVIGSPQFLPATASEKEAFRERIRRNVLRSYRPRGVGRQMLAILSAVDRRPALSKLPTASLVIHGREDPLVPLACGQATAKAIPGAKLDVIENMGHDLPEALWPQIVKSIVGHAKASQN